MTTTHDITPTRTAVAIRHVAFEDLGAFEAPLARAGYRVRYHDIAIEDLSSLDEPAADLLFVLGGPIGAYDTDKYAFLVDELALIERRIAAGRPIFGICLGAQLVARALGARVYPAGVRELGFSPIALTDAGRASCLAAFADGDVLHWHGDTFDLPAGAVHLASSARCRHQAFAFGEHVMAVQFHPEAGDDHFERWLVGNAGDLVAAGVDVRELRAAWRARQAGLAERAAACLGAWLATVPR